MEEWRELFIADSIPADVFDQLREQPDVCHPLGVEVGVARSEPGLGEGDVARVRLEGIGDGVQLGDITADVLQTST